MLKNKIVRNKITKKINNNLKYLLNKIKEY